MTPKALVKWKPEKCPMVIETWVGGQCKKIGVTTDDNRWDPRTPRACGGDEKTRDVGLPSGAVTIERIIGTSTGRVEIKLWPPNGKDKAVTINVQ